MLEARSPEEKDVLTAMWYQKTTADELSWLVTATEPHDVAPMTLTQALSTASRALDAAWAGPVVTKKTILEALRPVCRFVSAFVTEPEIGAEDGDCFALHPDHTEPALYGINARGLARITAVTHGFWKRRAHVARMVSAHDEPPLVPASEEETARALQLAKAKVDANAGEELTAAARNFVIARSMPKQILEDPRLAHLVKLKQFYMAMRETHPDGLNAVHRAGSVPPLLAITRGEHTLLREILVLLLLAKDTAYIDETTGDLPSTGATPRPGFFAGEYVVVTQNGQCRRGAGTGMPGCVAVAVELLKSFNPVEHEYVTGVRDSYKMDPPEKEFNDANCF